MMDIELLRNCAKCVYLACDKEVADVISKRLNNAADEITSLRQQLAEQTSGEHWHGHKFKELKTGLWKCECGKELHVEPSVEVLLEALRNCVNIMDKVIIDSDKTNVQDEAYFYAHREDGKNALNAYSSKPQKSD
jgi:hypothetical protein